jgi:hypothetical protein
VNLLVAIHGSCLIIIVLLIIVFSFVTELVLLPLDHIGVTHKPFNVKFVRKNFQIVKLVII